MSRYPTNRARLQVEELEGRQLLSAVPAPVPPPTAGQASQAPAPQPMIWTYTVVSLRNPTNAAVQVQFRWSHDSAWTTYTVSAHGYTYFYNTAYEPVAPQVRFDADVTPASQPVRYALRYNTVRTSGTPAYGDAYHYAFALQGTTLTLHPSAS